MPSPKKTASWPALDTTLTPDLVAEGIAREVVRYIQDARKNAGFAISEPHHRGH
jgi:isoleucyl-tRNA synthetase